MSKQANKTVIGFFVVGAIALAVVAIVVLGSGKFFKKTLRAVCYFEGDVGGLNMGAPVVFRGVKVGSVTGVILRAVPSPDPKKVMELRIPVFLEIEPETIEREKGARREPKKGLKLMIDLGLRAKLETQSIVTGQRQINLDFSPDKPARFVGEDPEYIEIPTIPTPMEEFVKKIEKIPFEQIFEKLSSALSGIDKIVNSTEIPEAIRSVNLALGDVQKLVKNVDGKVGSLASNLDETVKEVRGVVRNVDNRIGPLSASIEGTIKSVEATLTVAQKAIEKIEGTAGEDSTLVYELNKSLEEVRALARSIRVLADHLDRHPESVLWGK